MMLTVASPTQGNKATELKMPYGSGASLYSCFPVFHPCLGKIPASLQMTSSKLSLYTLFVLYLKVCRATFRVVFQCILLDGAILSACDGLAPLWGPTSHRLSGLRCCSVYIWQCAQQFCTRRSVSLFRSACTNKRK